MARVVERMCVPVERASIRARAAGITLIETLVTVAIIALVTTVALFGTGAAVSSRLRGGATMIAGAVRVAYTRASATSRPNRIVFDLDKQRVWLEESSDNMVVKANDTTGGAEAATQAEKDALAEATSILQGPRIARPRFRPVKALQSGEGDKDGERALGSGTRFRAVFTGHTPDGQTEGRAYLYFWPGGQTERAAIQLEKKGARPDEGLTILVSPLTGKARIVSGIAPMEPLRDDGTSSEREDTGF